jgi:PUA domain protein
MFGAKANVEVVESEVGLIYLLGGKPLLFRSDEIFPILTFKEFTDKAPKVVVDMGAIPYVCKGADVMAPEIRRIEGDFSRGDIVVVVDEKFGKTLALGESLYSSEEAKGIKKGAVLKTKHYVSDKVWNFAKTLSE